MTFDFTAARTNMVENQVRTNDVSDFDVQDAMRLAPRERFCASGRDFLAYAEVALDYAPGWSLMEPRDVSKLLQALAPKAGERALAIAAPYAALILARMGCAVTALQPEGEPAEAARKALAGEGVEVIAGDIARPGEADPYDLIVCEGAVTRCPAAWIEEVAVGGRLGVVERTGPVGKARLYLRGDDGVVARRELFDATPPIMMGFEAVPGFTF